MVSELPAPFGAPDGDHSELASAACWTEHERIRSVYAYYDSSDTEQRKRDTSNRGIRLNAVTRWTALRYALADLDLRVDTTLLDVGCGCGEDLQRIAAELDYLGPSLHGVDLLPDRIARARETLCNAILRVGAGEQLPYADHQFDVVLAATVFSSILDEDVARTLAREMVRVVGADGVILCYDVRYPNPWNPHTRAIGAAQLHRLFPEASIRLTPITLLPPLARRLGAFTKPAYRILHALPVLRSHYLAEIRAGQIPSDSRTVAGN